MYHCELVLYKHNAWERGLQRKLWECRGKKLLVYIKFIQENILVKFLNEKKKCKSSVYVLMLKFTQLPCSVLMTAQPQERCIVSLQGKADTFLEHTHAEMLPTFVRC